MSASILPTNISLASTKPIDWEILVDVISEGKCVLFLGPEATINYSDIHRQANFFTQILNNHSAEILSFHSEDGLFVFNDLRDIDDISRKVKTLYEEDYPSPMLTKLAQIPFHFIVSLSPDMALEKEMKKQGFPFDQDYYDTIKERSPNLPTSDTPPLIYHLFGIAERTNTLIVSHKQMYDYIKAFLGGTKLPQNVKTALNYPNAERLIFLGVNFDKWYFQLMLNMLGVDASSYKCFASIQSGANNLRTIWEKHFHINFVPHQINEFVDRLHEVFERKNKLRNLANVAQKKQYRNANFIKYFNVALSGTDLDTFCLSYFDEVYNDFTPEQGKSARINRLMEYVRQQDQYERLLELMKEENPVQFEKNAPYYDQQ